MLKKHLFYPLGYSVGGKARNAAADGTRVIIRRCRCTLALLSAYGGSGGRRRADLPSI